jgi:large subunit ribosomal protein L31
MKVGIHPKYNIDAKIKCSTCGTEYEFGTTLDSMSVAICAKCHPFYTGEQQVVIDSANKISSFKEKMDKAAELKKRMAEIEAKRKERDAKKVGVIGEKRVTLKDLLAAKQGKKA